VVGTLLEAQPLMALFLTFGEVIRALPADGNTLGGSHGTPPPSRGSVGPELSSAGMTPWGYSAAKVRALQCT